MRSRVQIVCWNYKGLRRRLAQCQSWLPATNIGCLVVQEAQFHAPSLTELPGFPGLRGRNEAG